MGTAQEYCLSCGSPNNIGHYCINMGLPRIFIEKHPYTCPNCAGYGNREKQNPNGGRTFPSCWSCHGTGVVWG
jgi:DnaJ-class molecular chaperone